MSQILKVVESRNEVQAILYTNLRISEGDNLEVKRQKRAIQVSVSQYLKSKRRRVEALIQNNFTRKDFVCTLTFTEDRLPAENSGRDLRCPRSDFPGYRSYCRKRRVHHNDLSR